MNQDQINEIKEALFSHFGLRLPADNDAINTMHDNYFRPLDPALAFDALIALGQKDLKARSINEAMAHYRDFYRLQKEKMPARLQQRVSYTHHSIPTKTIIKAIDKNDKRARANQGRCLQLYLDLVKFKYIQIPVQSYKGMFERIKDDINNMLKIMENKDFFEVSYMVSNKDQSDEETLKMLTVSYKDIATQIQGFVNKYSTEAEQQPTESHLALDSQRETEKENLPSREYNYLNLQD